MAIRSAPPTPDGKLGSVRNMAGYRRRGQRTRSSESGPDGDSTNVGDLNNASFQSSKTWTMKNFSGGGCWRGSRKSEAEDEESSTHDEVSTRKRGRGAADVVERKGSHVFMNSISALFSVRTDESDRARPNRGMPQNGRRSVTHFADEGRRQAPISV